MEVFILPFGKIIKINDNLAEVIIDDGIVMDSKKVKLYHDFILTHLSAPFCLLINKLHSYTYTFDAQLKIASLNELDCMAVVTYNYNSEMATKILLNLNKGKNVKVKIFKNRESALKWLN